MSGAKAFLHSDLSDKIPVRSPRGQQAPSSPPAQRALELPKKGERKHEGAHPVVCGMLYIEIVACDPVDVYDAREAVAGAHIGDPALTESGEAIEAHERQERRWENYRKGGRWGKGQDSRAVYLGLRRGSTWITRPCRLLAVWKCCFEHSSLYAFNTPRSLRTGARIILNINIFFLSSQSVVTLTLYIFAT
ncbi:hypothetical protein GGX14DRAFT_406568 [Mycena pura]|uniref:Uncharacterized protein n=1 Tax=Mycena pura TaxID=153505 RepID=A0AAD6UTT2_9AGAR|nr:hypothetical protein GGX14DRAFT_406568 [Mycena pura]